MKKPKARRRWFQFLVRMTLVAILLLGPVIAGSVMPLPDFAREWMPKRRSVQLIFTSEDLLELQKTWERIWFLDQPDKMTPERTNGGVILDRPREDRRVFRRPRQDRLPKPPKI
ncbi:MAG: hypothetical protein H8E44_19965 [Planctomycetes bacterium]|nr:hypothetical protein [Planctomycetota bacterium]MBL7037812.1 hypothetical protein [Pirellulaceae bacterium]